MDGNDNERSASGPAADQGVLGEAPYRSLQLPAGARGERLDGAVAFWWSGRLFVIARKHLPGSEIRKRTALYELTGDLERWPLEMHE